MYEDGRLVSCEMVYPRTRMPNAAAMVGGIVGAALSGYMMSEWREDRREADALKEAGYHDAAREKKDDAEWKFGFGLGMAAISGCVAALSLETTEEWTTESGRKLSDIQAEVLGSEEARLASRMTGERALIGAAIFSIFLAFTLR
jgi:hypothetical protein